IYPQFATHNAQTLASIYHMAGAYSPLQYEFQCLHGMGEPLYAQVVGPAKLDRPCRIYAPVGTHETLLAYLVRRLLENGANTSFINRIADPAVSVDELVTSPVESVRRIQDEEAALAAAQSAAGLWRHKAPAERAACLERAADAMEARLLPLMGLIVREAGKTYSNAIAEVREAVDFLRYYAGEVKARFSNDTHVPLGPVLCISPWNFPLAIFTGQVSAALAAGNPVIAKPAEQTPLIAAEAVRLLHEAGVPRDALQLMPGAGESVGASLVADPRVRGVVFTGST